MAPSLNFEAGSLLEDVSRAVGSDFAWVRIGDTQSQCMLHMDRLSLAAVILPVGIRSMVEAFTRVIPVSEAKATELLYHGALTADPAFLSAAAPGMQPLLQRVSEMMGSAQSSGSRVDAVVLDLPGGSIPGLSQGLQNLWPGVRVMTLESLGFRSPQAIPHEDDDLSGDGPAHSPENVQPPAAVDVLPERLEAAAPAPAIESVAGPLSNEPAPPTSQFLAWLFTLGCIVLALTVFMLFRQMGSLSNRVGRLTIDIQQVYRKLQFYSPDSPANQPTSVPAVKPVFPSMPAGSVSALPFQSGLFTSLLSKPQNEGAPPLALGPSDVTNRSWGWNGKSVAPARLLSPVILPGISSDAFNLIPAQPSGTPPALPPVGQQPAPTAPTTGSGGSASVPPLPENPPLVMPVLSPVAAQMSLKEVLELASQRSLGAQAALWRTRETDAINSGSRAQLRPRWDISGAASSTANVVNTAPGLSASYLGTYVSAPIDLVGRDRVLSKIARASHSDSATAEAVAREQSAYNAAIAYIDALNAEAEVGIGQEMVALERRQLQTARLRLAEGFVMRLDVAQAGTRTSGAEQQLATAITDVELAEMRLGSAVRVGSGGRVEPKPNDDWLAARAAVLQFQPSAGLASGRYAVVQGAQLVKEREYNLELAKKGMAPSVRAYAGVSLLATNQNGPEPVVGVTASLPLNDGGVTSAAVRQARAALEEAKVLEQQAIDSAASEINTAQIGLKRAQEKEVYADSAIDTAREAVRVVGRRYEAGFAGFADVANAETQLSGALEDRNAAHLAVLRAQLDLLKATGRLTTP